MNLSPHQFSSVVKTLPEIRSQMKKLGEVMLSKPEKVKEILGEYYSWAFIYELPFVEQLAYLSVLLGFQESLVEASKAKDITQATIDLAADGGVLDRWYEANEEKIEKKHLIWLSFVMQRNILSIMLFHRSLGALVHEVRTGSDDAFFKAVSIDRTILLCPTFSDRLSYAELTNDKTFFLHLRKALKGPSKKNMEAIGDLRYAIVLLRDMGFNKFTDDELIGLFVGNGLYPKSYNAAKNLRKHIHTARKFSTT
ncbi:hypothetical protein LG204_06105 [Methylovorus menthalis]|uniref:hypothetical protein n=1 Tax=Methylovorus menthalis TaxID=1002227 RepID=UPI001E3CDA96|nr:hypothetical protein [Methylovorus menthalis]MCB4810884.1 hypothetical protein [Methylovorus menthalis]